MLLCIAGGIALFIGVITWAAACQADTDSACHNGGPSFELVFQLVLAVAGFAGTFAVRYFVNRRAYPSARAAVAVTIVLLAAWLVLVDAVTHGWDELQATWALLIIVVLVAALAIVTALLRRRR